jgi:hypothetical protein
MAVGGSEWVRTACYDSAPTARQRSTLPSTEFRTPPGSWSTPLPPATRCLPTLTRLASPNSLVGLAVPTRGVHLTP